ncbi:MAG TPA: hypothetical protein VFC31_15665 [Candidatus Limnocylindria bacterium]|nr:hypothetical protein [Candidatus Limnocylindria bacterium]
MRAFVAAAVFALVLGGAPAVAFADEGDADAATQADDPGIAHLHDAITDMRDANTALRAECPDRSDAKCRAELEKARDAFKIAREKAIEEHHAFKEDQKKAREAAKEKLKGNAKEQAKDKAKEKAKEAPAPSASPRA